MHGVTRKGRTQSNTVHFRGRQNQLPRCSCHPNSGHAGGKNALQQHHIHKGCTLHGNGHLKLLPNDTTTWSRIHRMKLSNIPDKVIEEYKLQEKATKSGSIYIRAKQGMYGLPQSGLLANELLEKRLNKHGYLTKQIGTRPLEARHTANTIHIGRGQLWGEICWRGTCPASKKDTRYSSTVTNSPAIGQEHTTSGSHWTGTTTNDKCICQYQTA
jgi:hypothetical protein